MRKLNIILITAMLLIAVMPSVVFAESEDEGAQTKGPICQYTVAYNESDTSSGPTGLQTHQAINETGTSQNMSVTYTRTKQFTGNVSVAAERELILWKIGGEVEVGYGQTESETLTATVTVPPYTMYYCKTGSLMTTTTGKIKYIYTDCSQSSKNVNLQFTTGKNVRWYE